MSAPVAFGLKIIAEFAEEMRAVGAALFNTPILHEKSFFKDDRDEELQDDITTASAVRRLTYPPSHDSVTVNCVAEPTPTEPDFHKQLRILHQA